MSLPQYLPAGRHFDQIRVLLPHDAGVRLERAVAVFARQVEKRCPARVVLRGDAQMNVAVSLDPSLGMEGYRIVDRADGTIEVAGHNELGVLYGLGKFLRTSRYSDDGFTPGSWRGESVPQKPFRGIYFATHFHNYYHEAPIEEIEFYVEELALWGYNTLLVWYDMHHFNGFQDPEAAAFRERLYAICETAREIGLEIGIINPANEAYGNSPLELRVREDVKRGGWYDCAVCPERTDQAGHTGMEYILTILGEMYDWIAPLGPKYVVIWPYDQGGCGCEKCRPWGSNGFMKTGAAAASPARSKMPGVQIVASTWYMDDDEWKGIEESLAEKYSWPDLILAEGQIRKIDGLPMVGFPEISMAGMFPWGGFGASIRAAEMEQKWDKAKDVSAGGFPYSEGIYEDVTKAVYGQLYWSDRPSEETLKEYIAYEYSPEHVDTLYNVMLTLEQNHHFRWWPGQLSDVDPDVFPEHWIPNRGHKPQADPGAEEAWAAVQQVEKSLPEWVRLSWRWRLFYLRTLLDSELKTNGGEPNTLCNRAFEELNRIYYADAANPAVRPPLP